MDDGRFRLPDALVAFVVGGVFAYVAAVAVGYIAAWPFPVWFVPFAQHHKPLALIVWSLVSAGMPNLFLAALCAVALAQLTRGQSRAPLWVAFAAWVSVAIALAASGLGGENALSLLQTASFQYSPFSVALLLNWVLILLGLHLAFGWAKRTLFDR